MILSAASLSFLLPVATADYCNAASIIRTRYPSLVETFCNSVLMYQYSSVNLGREEEEIQDAGITRFTRDFREAALVECTLTCSEYSQPTSPPEPGDRSCGLASSCCCCQMSPVVRDRTRRCGVECPQYTSLLSFILHGTMMEGEG